MNKVLVVDDDKNLLETLKYNLVRDGCSVLTASNGIQALDMACTERPDLIILDVMLPGIDGFEVCRLLRQEMTAPILILTAKTEEVDRVVGLELGADDYVTKPFSVRELMARVRIMLRRAQASRREASSIDTDASQVIKVDDIELDVQRHVATRLGLPLHLRPKEFELLAFLMRHRGQVFSRERLVEKIWGYSHEGTARTVDVHVRSLRRKIEDDPSNPARLITVHGFGYKFGG
jgi:two-component system OmpR family response regulator